MSTVLFIFTVDYVENAMVKSYILIEEMSPTHTFMFRISKYTVILSVKGGCRSRSQLSRGENRVQPGHIAIYLRSGLLDP